MHRAASVERGYFLPPIGSSDWAGPLASLCLDKDAVCGPLLGACVAACVRRPDPPLDVQGGGRGWVVVVVVVIFIPLLY